MKEKQLIEIFSAGCPICLDAIKEITEKYAGTYEVRTLDMHDADVATQAKHLGIKSVPSVVIDGKIADCCGGRGINLAALPEVNIKKGGCCCG